MPSIVQPPSLKFLQPPTPPAQPSAPKQNLLNSPEDRPSFDAALDAAKVRPRDKTRSERIDRDRDRASDAPTASSKTITTKSSKPKRDGADSKAAQDDSSPGPKPDQTAADNATKPADADALSDTDSAEAAEPSNAEDLGHAKAATASSDNPDAATIAVTQTPNAPASTSAPKTSTNAEDADGATPAPKTASRASSHGAAHAIRKTPVAKEPSADPDDAAAAEATADASDSSDELPENSAGTADASAQPTQQSPAAKRGIALGDAPIDAVPATAVQQQAATNTSSQATQADVEDLAVAATAETDSVSEIAAAPPKTQAADSAGDRLDPAAKLEATLAQAPTAGQSNFTSALKAAHAPDASGTASATPPEQQFAADNHSRIIDGIHGQLLPGGGTMHLKLDPPELGALQVTVHMQDGVMTASFQTSSDDATRLLSHSLTQLKHVLEQQGVSVEKLHVTQTSRDSNSSFDDQRGGQQQSHEQSAAQQEQQRREMLRRMWRRLTNGSDPLDLVA